MNYEYDKIGRHIVKCHEKLLEASSGATKSTNSSVLGYQVGLKKDGSPADHYSKMKIQSAEFFLANMSDEELRGVLKFNMLRYSWRDKEDFLEDLDKAKHYIEMITKELRRRDADKQT